MANSKQIYVSIQLGDERQQVGKLWCHQRKNRERFAIDPALQLTEGAFYTCPGQALFGAIGDSAPDRWGHILIQRFESMRAKRKGQAMKPLLEIDYLLAVNDESRQGALRFSLQSQGPYLTRKNRTSIPPLIDLPRLLSASENFLNDNETEDDLKILLAPGSSLGGARPKVSVYDKNGRLAIAKFPKKDDEYNVVVWEAVALKLAQKAGLQIPEVRLENIQKKPVLIIQRFDRIGNKRIPFLSAMSMLGAKDNDRRSYLEIAHALIQYGEKPDQDMAELWRRIVFTVLISNTDDHLRNHGFLYERHKGWRLSPAYDINPNPIDIKDRILSTSISFNDSTASIDTALSVIDEFRLEKNQAYKIVKQVATAVSSWRDIAQQFGLSKKEIDRMASAFEHAELKKAKKMYS